MEHYKANQLTEAFYFTRPTATPDGAGGRTMTPVRNPTSGYHFAMVRPLRGEERLVGGGLAATSECLFVVRSSLGIQATDTLVYKGTSYNVRRINVAVRSGFQEIEATAGEAL